MNTILKMVLALTAGVALAVVIILNMKGESKVLLTSKKEHLLSNQDYICSHRGSLVKTSFIAPSANNTKADILISIDNDGILYKNDIQYTKVKYDSRMVVFINKEKTIKTAIKFNVTTRENQLMMIETYLKQPITNLYNCNKKD